MKFSDSLIVTGKGDKDAVRLADEHYSRQQPGTVQFMPPGKTLVIRDAEGLVVFGWLWNLVERYDKQEGYNCTIFRNTSARLSSEIILECEELVSAEWGSRRMFTYVDATKIQSPNPGYCFKQAGWRFVGKSKSGLHLLEKEP